MARAIFSICGRRKEDGWRVERYAYVAPYEDGDLVTDSRYCFNVVSRLQGGGSSWNVNQEPPPECRRFIDVIVTVVNHGKANAHYGVDRHAYPKSPSEAIEDGMTIERMIRKEGVTPANRYETIRKKAREKERRAKREFYEREMKRLAELPRFVTGCRYFSKTEDGFGHLVDEILFVVSRDDKSGEIEFTYQGRTRRTIVRLDETDGEYVRIKALCRTVWAKNSKQEGVAKR